MIKAKFQLARFKFKDFSSTFKHLICFQALSKALKFLFQSQAFSRISQARYKPCMNTRRESAYTFSNSPGGSIDFTPRCIFNPNHPGLDFDVYTPLSSITTLVPQSPLHSRPIRGYHPSLLYLGFLTLPPPPLPPPPSFPPLSQLLLHAYNMPIRLHYIQLYRFVTRDDVYDVTIGLQHNAEL